MVVVVKKLKFRPWRLADREGGHGEREPESRQPCSSRCWLPRGDAASPRGSHITRCAPGCRDIAFQRVVHHHTIGIEVLDELDFPHQRFAPWLERDRKSVV